MKVGSISWKTGALKPMNEDDIEAVARILCVNDPNVPRDPDTVMIYWDEQPKAWEQYVDSAIAIIGYLEKKPKLKVVK